MFKNWSIKRKILAAFYAVAICLLIIGGVGFFNLKHVSQKYDHIIKRNFPKSVALAKLWASQKDVVGATNSLVRNHSNASEVAEQKAIIDSAVKDFETAAKDYETNEWAPGEETKWIEIKKDWSPFKDLVYKVVSLSTSGTKEDEAARDGLSKTQYAGMKDKLLHEFSDAIDFQSKNADEWIALAQSSTNTGNIVSLALAGLGFGLALLIGLIFSSLLSKKLTLLASKMLENATSVAGSSQQVSSAGTELSSSATEQAAALQQTVAAIKDVSAMVQKNADNAKRSQETSTLSHSTVMRGKKAVESMIQSIEDIKQSNNDITQQIESSNQQISDIVKVISEIGNKTKVINDIVFQTKLLSFNASVEAARAGEHGKGFAVVAEEVGNLAQMSGNAAKEISQMLDGSIQKVESIVHETKGKVEKLVLSGREKVNAGTDTAKQCGDVLDEIVRNVSNVNQMIGEILITSNEQAQGVDEINKAMTQMDQVTLQNATASQEVAGASEQLTGQAQSLRSLVEGLLRTVEGKVSILKKPNGNRTSSSGLGSANVLAFKKKNSSAEKAVPHGSVPRSAKKPIPEQSLKSVVPARAFKKAVGTENLPAQDDPRFEDV